MATNFGGLRESAFWAEELALPVVIDTVARQLVNDSLDQAVAERKGVLLTAAKGSGKTMAVEQVVMEFEEVERQAELADGNHIRKNLVKMFAPREADRRSILDSIWHATVGMPPIRVRGRRLSEDDLLNSLVLELLRQNVAVLVIDEAEFLSEEALYILRDIMSLAEQRSGERYAHGRFKAAGVGMLLIGTPDLKPRVRMTGEAGHRWLRMQDVPALEPAEVADVYVQYLPGLAKHVKKIGKKAWLEFVRVTVCEGRPIPIRVVENHVRNYIRRMAAANDALHSIEHVGFDQPFFIYTLNELLNAQRDAA